jgi:hypothetical protein
VHGADQDILTDSLNEQQVSQSEMATSKDHV